MSKIRTCGTEQGVMSEAWRQNKNQRRPVVPQGSNPTGQAMIQALYFIFKAMCPFHLTRRD